MSNGWRRGRKNKCLSRPYRGRPSINGAVFLYREKRDGDLYGVEHEGLCNEIISNVLIKIETRMMAQKQMAQKVFGWRSVIPSLSKNGIPEHLLEVLAKKIYTQSYANVFGCCPPSGWQI